MTLYRIDARPDERYQIITVTLPLGRNNIRLRFEIRYLNEPGMIASYGGFNNLLEAFAYKQMGCLAVIPLVEHPQSENPGLNNLNEFEIVWGESFAE